MTDDSFDSSSSTSATESGCQGYGKEEMERGYNGEGRIQGGISTVPGFGWWPIKTYRPCHSYVATGGRYWRTGQSMDEIGFGRGLKLSLGREDGLDGIMIKPVLDVGVTETAAMDVFSDYIGDVYIGEAEEVFQNPIGGEVRKWG
ncbi:OLC1v1025161C1 [Oldenlandia corymbosa var. corymbosa]|uniref:OLC1v1025161C1 n=1 Tax=Oldenlandia corymbosa var. corymbosa TaxID=529605 RepID=A0AAV1C5T0_OLDCO|nr:OLC1v1025161C1 [Oldenlandia corymbosa var. corymbosa]